MINVLTSLEGIEYL
jgi:hypothetical protein